MPTKCCARLSSVHQIQWGDGQSRSAETAQHEGSHRGDAIEITVDMDDSEVVIKRCLSNEQIGDRDPMPKAVMMSKVLLKLESPLKDIRWRIDHSQAAMQARPHLIIVASRPSGHKLLQFAYRAQIQ